MAGSSAFSYGLPLECSGIGIFAMVTIAGANYGVNQCETKCVFGFILAYTAGIPPANKSKEYCI